MTNTVAIALDAMGGDRAPGMVISGANIARKRFPQARFHFYGDEARIGPLIGKLAGLAKVSSIQHCEREIRADDKPSTAVRSGRGSSMWMACEAVRNGRAAGVVSAGNTGALMGIAKFLMKTLPGIDRPAICSFFPTLRGESCMIDLGANVDCDADNLVQFAIMGEAFSRTVMGMIEPTIGLLNVGSEEMKGHEAVRDAAAVLRTGKMPGRFHGFVEGDDIAKGTVDVVVTDGFTGNIALKTIEGTVKLYNEFMGQTFRSSLLSRIAFLLARSALRGLRVRTDPRRYNGAVFLGLNGVVVKSHGGTDELGFANAVGVAVDMVLHGTIDKITEDLIQVTAMAAPETKAANS
ncbi:MAG: phosphate acyltransferase PlsX [Dongiaceae bacterium]